MNSGGMRARVRVGKPKAPKPLKVQRQIDRDVRLFRLHRPT